MLAAGLSASLKSLGVLLKNLLGESLRSSWSVFGAPTVLVEA
jgi:hypothetical protein